MIVVTPPLLAVIEFLIITLAVGVYVNQKKITFREYAVGNKDFSTATLVVTILATVYSGASLIRSVERIHNQGLYWIIILLLSCFGLWMLGFVAIRMGPFMGHLSISETIGQVYGKRIRLITSFVTTLSALLAVAGQLETISMGMTLCYHGVNARLVTIGATFILIFYATCGGIRSITFTDVFQCITFMLVLPLLAWLLFKTMNQPLADTLSLLSTRASWQPSKLCYNKRSFFSMFSFVFAILSAYVRPDLIQRIYMASSPMQARKMFNHAAVLNITIIASIIFIGLFVSSVMPTCAIGSVWRYIIDSMPAWFKGLFYISLLAMAMSTADSLLHTSAIMASHDICDLATNFRIYKPSAPLDALHLARWATLVLGLSAMVLTFYFNNLFELFSLYLDIALPITTPPFILAVFGFRGTERTALIGMATGLLSIIAWNKWIEPATDMNGAFFAMLANGLAMLTAHYLLAQPEKCGWIAPSDASSFEPAPKKIFLN